LTNNEGRIYRLPTEAEWEYACRAGTTGSAYNGSGEEGLTLIGNIADAAASQKFPAWTATKFNDGFVYTSPVGQFRPNNFGLFDTIGNATEWCSDWYAGGYYASSPANDPRGPADGPSHVVRGGSFTDKPSISVSRRIHFTPNHRAFDCGFRVVCEIPVKATARVVVPPAVPGDGRHLWVGTTQFAMIAAGKWSETKPEVPGHSILFFDEVARTPQYVELIDKTRGKAGLRIRLEETQALIQWIGRDKDFKLLKHGQWVSTVEPPPTTVTSVNDSRHVWTGTHSKFENLRPSYWQETRNHDGKVFKFGEVTRTDEYVELLDPGRVKGEVRVRLLKDKMLVFWQGTDKDWRQSQTGQWQSGH
jgi:hypothetical protein